MELEINVLSLLNARVSQIHKIGQMPISIGQNMDWRACEY